MRSITFETDEFYHVFNRGNNKRPIFLDEFDLLRFLQSMREFNTVEPIGSIYENFFRKKELGDSIFKQQKLVDLVCYCLNPNHFHLTVKQLVDDGVRRFMHRVGTGFTKYFNQKYKTSGALFQGRYKALHVDSNEYLLHLSAYVNLNNRVHGALGSSTSKLSKTSWDEYTNHERGQTKDRDLCNKEIILAQFRNPAGYREFAESSLLTMTIKERKDTERILKLGS